MVLPVSSPQLQGFDKNWVNKYLFDQVHLHCFLFAGSNWSWKYNYYYFPVADISIMVISRMDVLVRSLFSGDVLADETDKSVV